MDSSALSAYLNVAVIKQCKVFEAELHILQVQVRPDKESNIRGETKHYSCESKPPAPGSFSSLGVCLGGLKLLNLVNQRINLFIFLLVYYFIAAKAAVTTNTQEVIRTNS